MKYIGLPRYTENTMKELIQLGYVGSLDGVILGDLTCNKKMFPYGGSEIVSIFEQMKSNKIRVIYQSPMYLTDRIFSRTVQDVIYYFQKEYVDAVIVQDIGLASVLKARCPELQLIWGRMGYSRTPIMNMATVAFYIEQGIHGFECKTIAEANYLFQIGKTPYLLVGHPHYLTVNRECYYKFEHNIFDNQCDCGCLKGERLDICTDPPIVSRIDGYFLGYENVYSEENILHAGEYTHTMVYADTMDTLIETISRIR